MRAIWVRSGMQVWEAAAVGCFAVLAGWATSSHVVTALAGLALGLLSVISSVRSRRLRCAAVGAVMVAAAGVAVVTSVRIHRIESDWEVVREGLVQLGSESLARLLSDAVGLARSLNEAGLATRGESGPAAFKSLAATTAGAPMEAGVAVYGPDGRPVSWGGRFRVYPATGPDELSATITPFYSVLEARQELGGLTAVSQVVLDADSLIPAYDGSVASLFLAATGSRVEFINPRNAPEESDVFDYCIPSCSSSDVRPDTLFSVRTIPPGQGILKLRVSFAGGQRVVFLVLIAGLLLLAFGGLMAKRLIVFGLCLLFVVTPAGSLIGFDALFSPATYFWSALGIFSSSAGSLMSGAALAVIAIVGLWRTSIPRSTITFFASALLVASAPYAMRLAARGITPPAHGAGVGMWISWELALTAISVALVIVAAYLVRGVGLKSPGWMAWVAAGLALGVAALGLIIWDPISAWPEWYTFLWVPALILAVQPTRKIRLVVTIAVVTGSASALLTWGAAVEGRLVVADRELERTVQEIDLLQLSMLETLGSELSAADLPTTESDLLSVWRGSRLAVEGYVGLLASWDPDGTNIARLDLAALNISDVVLREAARDAGRAGEPEIRRVESGTGIRNLLTVPYSDGSALTVGVGPATSLASPTSVGFYLGLMDLQGVPFEVSVSEPVSRSENPEQLEWVRRGWRVRGTRAMSDNGVVRHLHVDVSLRGFGRLLVRGALTVLVNIVLIAGLWLLGEMLAGGLVVPLELKRAVNVSSYRVRLTAVLAAFFVLPTVGFSAWTLNRIGSHAERDRELSTRGTLKEVAAAVAVGNESGLFAERVTPVGERFGVDIALYVDGVLVRAGNPLFSQSGIFGAFLPGEVYSGLVLEDEIEMVKSGPIGREITPVGYRILAAGESSSSVLAMPAPPGAVRLGEEQEDLIMAVLLATILGLAAAAWLAAFAARSLSHPVRALQQAAAAVGRGEPITPFEPRPMAEFQPVMLAFEKMESDVREHQAALVANLRLTSAVLQNVATGIIALDKHERVTASNRRAEDLLGVSLEVGATMGEQVPAEWRDITAWVSGFIKRGGETESDEFTVGHRRVSARVAVLEGEEGGCVVALDDATELARAERVIAWGEMARQVAHEVKNPLTPIRLGIQHLQRSHRDDRTDFSETLERTSRQILAEIERLDAIARAFSRFGSPSAESEPVSETDLAKVIRETVDLYSVSADLEIVVESAAEVVFGTARPDELKEVLVNMIENARDAGAGRIGIQLSSEPGGDVTIEVRDDGRGIEPEVLPRVFEPQFSTTTSGTGLGLAICKRLVESWGAAITVRSDKGEGTTVTINLSRRG